MASIVVVALQGNHLGRISEIVNAFDLVETQDNNTFKTFPEAANFMEPNYESYLQAHKELLCFWYDSGWTMICDPLKLAAVDFLLLDKLSKIFNTEVVAFHADSKKSIYVFQKFVAGHRLRSFVKQGDKILEGGVPYPQEQGLKIGPQISVKDIFELGTRWGVNMNLTSENGYLVKVLECNDVKKKKWADTFKA